MGFLDILQPFESKGKSQGGGGAQGYDDLPMRQEQQRSLSMADNYAQNKERFARSQTDMDTEDMRRALRGRIQNNDKSLASRGLLHSGLRAGAQGQAYGDYTRGMQEAQNRNIQSTNDQYEDMLNAIVGRGAQNQQAQSAFNQQNYQQALAERQANQNVLGNLGRGLGKMI